MPQKKILDLTLRADMDATCNFAVDDASQTWRVTGAQLKTWLQPISTLGDLLYGGASGASTRLPGNTTTTMNVLTQTGNGTVSAAPAWRAFKAPTIQKFTTAAASGTYTTPAGVMYIKVRMVGGGGGGGGSANSSNNGGNGGSGTASTFGSSLLTANGGGAGSAGTAYGGDGGTVTINSPAVDVVRATGGSGGSSANPGSLSGNFAMSPPMGGSSYFGGAGSFNNAVGKANTGGGGGGGQAPLSTITYSGSGGGAGGYLEAIIVGPSATYNYAVGSGGNGGGAGSSGNAGGAGGSGVIIVEEYYQ